MSTVTDDIESEFGNEAPPEPERIALRSSLATMELPDFPSFDTKVELPSQTFPTLLPKTESAPAKNRIAEPLVSEPSKPKDLDVVHFPNRAMLPEFAALAIVSATWVMGVVPLLPAWWQSWEIVAAIPGAYGLFVFVRWMFHLIGGGYRLTNQQLLRINAGPIPDPEPIDLRSIVNVKVAATIVETCLCVGRLHLSFERGIQPELILGPAGWPRRRAQILEQAIESARTGAVVGSKIPA